MADVKISQLTALASANVVTSSDVLPIVDASVPQTKKITVENLLSPITIDKSAGTITSLGTIAGNVVINKASNPTYLQIGSSLTDDPYMVFQSDGNTFAMGIDRSDSSRFKISDNATLGTNDRFEIDATGLNIFRYTGAENTVQIHSGTGSSTTGVSQIYFTSKDEHGGNTHQSYIKSTIDGSSSTSATKMSFHNRDSGGTVQEYLTIKADGNIGINETSPYDDSWGASSKQLTITGSDYAVINLKDHDTKFAVGAGDGRHYMSYDDNNSRHNLIADADGVLRSSKGMEFEGTALGAGQTGVASSGDGGDLRIYTNGTQSTTFNTNGSVSFTAALSVPKGVGYVVHNVTVSPGSSSTYNLNGMGGNCAIGLYAAACMREGNTTANNTTHIGVHQHTQGSNTYSDLLTRTDNNDSTITRSGGNLTCTNGESSVNLKFIVKYFNLIALDTSNNLA